MSRHNHHEMDLLVEDDHMHRCDVLPVQLVELQMAHCCCCDNLVLGTGHVSCQESFEEANARDAVEILLGIAGKELVEYHMHFEERSRVIEEQIQLDWLDQGEWVVKIFWMLRQILASRLWVMESVFSSCHLCMDLCEAEFEILVCRPLLRCLLVVNTVSEEVNVVGRTFDQVKLAFLVSVVTVEERSLGRASEVGCGLDYRKVI